MEINEEKLKEILKEQRKEYQDYLGVVTEDFQPQVKLVAESVSGIQTQLIAIREMVAKNTEDIEAMKIEMMAMKEDISFIKFELKRRPSLDEFEALEKRVMFLEKKFSQP